MSFVAVPFLTRILPPSEFGLVALALALVAFMLYMGDAGLAKSLVRTDAEDTLVWSSVFWATLAFTGLLSLLLVGLAYPAALFFEQPRLFPIMAALACLPLVQGLLAAPTAELTKREKFITLAAAEFASAICGVVVAIWMAFDGFGAWALVAQNITLWSVKALVIIASSRFRPRFMFSFDRLGEHLIFARDTLGFAITSFIGRQTDQLVIGKLIGTAALGLYSIAFRIMSLPAHIVGGSIQSALFPKFVQLRDDHTKLRQVVLMSTAAQAALIFPGMAAVAASSHAFFTLLLSERWSEGAIIFALMAPAGALQAVTNMNGVLLQSIARTGARLRLTVEYAVLWVVAAPLLSLISLEAVAFGFSALFILYLPRLLHLYLAPIGCSIGEYLKALAAPTFLALALFGVHIGLVAAFHPPPWEEVLLALVELIAAYLAYVLIGWRQLRAGLTEMRALFSGAPAP